MELWDIVGGIKLTTGDSVRVAGEALTVFIVFALGCLHREFFGIRDRAIQIEVDRCCALMVRFFCYELST